MEQASERDGAPSWDLTGMTSAYCNVATAAATRDAVAINLGVSQSGGERVPAELRFALLHRVVLSPRAAMHLHQTLGRLLGEHDARRGGRG